MPADIQPHTSKQVTFQVFRYQLLVDKAVQLRIDSPYQSFEDIRQAKNDIFQSLITNKHFYFKSSKSEITSKLVYSSGTLSYFRIAVKRQRRISKPDFSEEVIPDYPNILIAINNHPEVQKIAVQSNLAAFKEPDIVSHILRDSLDKEIQKEGLSFYLEPMFDKQEFWNLVARYPKQIKQVSFELISPNMANISRNLQMNIKEVYEDTNSHKTRIELNSDKDSHLEINPESKLINSLVDYASEGGGNIAARVEGLRKKIHTAQSKMEFSVEEQLLKGTDWEALDQVFRNIML